MDILDQAIDFEYRGNKFYAEHAAKATHPAVKAILSDLAADELRHADFLKQIKAGAAREFKPTQSFHHIRDVIQQTVMNNLNFLSDEVGIQDVLIAALAFEDKARRHYESEAFKVYDAEVQGLLKRLAREEQRHYNLIDSLLKFIDNPKNILETQEFQHYDE